MLYLYDPRYNLKTETTYEKMCRLFVKTKGTLQSYKSKNRKVNKRYYIIDENTSKKQLKEFYSKEIFKDEIWKTIEGSEGQFIISNYGRFKKIYKSIPEGKFLLPYFVHKRRCNKDKQFIKVKFQGEYKEYNVARLVAYHFVDIYYTNDKVIRKSKDRKYKAYTYDDVTAFCKKYKLELKTNYVETTEYAQGKIISQSRVAGTEIVEGTTLTVDIATKPTEKKTDDKTTDFVLGTNITVSQVTDGDALILTYEAVDESGNKSKPLEIKLKNNIN